MREKDENLERKSLWSKSKNSSTECTKTLRTESERLNISVMRRRKSKKKRFKGVFNHKFIPNSFMKDQSLNQEETQFVLHDLNKKVLNFTELWQRPNLT